MLITRRGQRLPGGERGRPRIIPVKSIEIPVYWNRALDAIGDRRMPSVSDYIRLSQNRETIKALDGDWWWAADVPPMDGHNRIHPEDGTATKVSNEHYFMTLPWELRLYVNRIEPGHAIVKFGGRKGGRKMAVVVGDNLAARVAELRYVLRR